MTQAAQDLIDLAAKEGLTLPYPAETIARLEATGAIIVGGADVRYSLTLLGQANAIVWESENNQL